METENEALVCALNDLILINHDRILGYEKALEEIGKSDKLLRSMFENQAAESRSYGAELSRVVLALGGEPASGTTTTGKIYRLWMDLKASLEGKDSRSALELCEFGEDAAQRAYAAALDADIDYPSDIRKMILHQKTLLRTSHDMISSCRDLLKNQVVEKPTQREG